jgi:hypothetical protein
VVCIVGSGDPARERFADGLLPQGGPRAVPEATEDAFAFCRFETRTARALRPADGGTTHAHSERAGLQAAHQRAGEFQNTKYLLYRYATRMLLARVSWLCRDQRRVVEGDGFAEVIFSNRSNMSYEEIREYLRLLLRQSEANPQKVQIDRTVIDPDRIRSVEHSKLAGLQVADAVASGFHFALKVNRYGETEPAYLGHLKKTLYRHQSQSMGYGIKVWPEDYETIKAKAPEAINLGGM